jgi:hypothetical protein
VDLRTFGPVELTVDLWSCGPEDPSYIMDENHSVDSDPGNI